MSTLTSALPLHLADVALVVALVVYTLGLVLAAGIAVAVWVRGIAPERQR